MHTTTTEQTASYDFTQPDNPRYHEQQIKAAYYMIDRESRRYAGTTAPTGEFYEFYESLFSQGCLWLAKQAQMNRSITIRQARKILSNKAARIKFNMHHHRHISDDAEKAEGRGITALKIFIAQRGDAETRLGRPLTPKEQDTLARTIRTTWPDTRHRPPIDSFRFLAPISLDDPNTTAHTTLTQSAEQTVIDGPDIYADFDEDRYHGGKTAKKAKMAYTLLDQALPGMIGATYRKEKASRIRADLHESGKNVCAIITDYIEGEGSIEIDAFFSPFAGADTEWKREQLCEWFLAHSWIADDLWDLLTVAATYDPDDILD